ncbi:hypothetical protein C5N99_07330 [Treponema medium]|uniref:SUMF1/EgtB/PvdO family nonheme iron enzyme n=1 Tax=Treponema medium TaxID=58231 RepID=UPI00197F611A|nr:hypothetical protein C5N99_06610 [Treponema medium]QSH92412.1 hypothetical protein C5N99_07330 [Treponema medium]
MKINVNKKSGVLLGLAAVLMLAAMALFTGCPNKITVKPETFAVTFSAGEHGTLKAKADSVTETDKSPISVEKDKTVVFTAVPEKGYEVEKWTVNGTAVANNVSTTYSHKVTAAVTVKVSFKALPPSAVAVTGVTLDKPTVSLVAGTSTTLTATVLPANATNKTVAWSSDKPAIASVDKNGTVTAHKAGEAVIIVTTEDGGKTASCKVNVTAKPPTTYKVTFSVDGTGGTLKAKADGVTETDKSPISVEKDKTVTFTATADSGYRVKGWTRDGEAVNGTNDSYSFTVTKGIEVKVSFESNSVPPTPPSGDFIKISPPAAGITGMDPAPASLPGSESYWKGVFRAGRKVKLSPYKLGKTEVPYKLWKEVYDWAIGNGYTFANEGQKGSSGSGSEEEPVTKVSWRDCIVWCNAYTQKMNSTDTDCVYRKGGDHNVVLKNATDATACDAAYADMSKKGFRLPTEAEWEYAARWQGSDNTNADKYGEVWLTKLNSASGAKGKWDTAETGAVARYDGNSGGKTHPVGKKRANALGLHDMSGNVWEWCFDWYGNIEAEDVMDPQGAPAASGSGRVLRGGCWRNDAEGCVVGFRISFNPDISYDDLGFRVARSKIDLLVYF